MKLILIDPVDGTEVEVKDKVVRHVRTPEGQRRFGQPIGAVITRDMINRDRRKRGLKPLPDSGGSSGGSDKTPDKTPSKPKTEAAPARPKTSRQERTDRPPARPKLATSAADRPQAAPDAKFKADTVVNPQRRDTVRQETLRKLVDNDPDLQQEIDFFNDDLSTSEDVDAAEERAKQNAQRRVDANEKALRRVAADAQVFVQVRSDVIPEIVKSGRFKNTHDEDTHGHRAVDLHDAAASQENRDRFEGEVFGASRPVYGYLSARPDGANSEMPSSAGYYDTRAGIKMSYGGTAIKLKRDRVANRTTFTVGDSYAEQDDIAPTPLNAPSWEAAGQEDVSKARTVDDLVPLAGASYVEAQVHGDLTLDDIESVSFDEQPDPDVSKALDDAGIPWSIAGLQSGASDPNLRNDRVPAAPQAAGPNVGDEVRLDDGRQGEVGKVYANGDIRFGYVAPGSSQLTRERVPAARIAETVHRADVPGEEKGSGLDGLNGLPEGQRKELLDAHAEMAKKYTVAPARVTASEQDWPGGESFALGGNTVSFNPKISDPDYLGRNVGNGYVAAENMHDAYIHELGHTLGRRLQQDDPQAYQELVKALTPPPSAPGVVQGEFNPDFRGDYSQRDATAWKYPEGSRGEFIEMLSGYADESVGEAISEAFLRQQQGRDNKYVDAVKTAFARYERQDGAPDLNAPQGSALESTRMGNPDGLEEVRTGDLKPGDRFLIFGESARVTNVQQDGNDFVVDVVYDKDGTADSIYGDPDELVNRIVRDDGGKPPLPENDEIGPADLKPGDLFDPGNGQKLRVVKNGGTVNGMPSYAITFTDEDGNENTLMFGRAVKLRRLPSEPPEPEPDLDPPPKEVSVSAGDVKVGDQIADTDGDPLTVIAVRKNKTTGLNDIVTINSNGEKQTNSFSDAIALARTREAIEPDALLPGQRSGRVALATYQRRNLAILDLDHDESLDDQVRQAAARIRLKQEIGAGQSKALAAHLNDLALQEQNPRKQRSLQRLASQVGAVDARLNGEDVPVVREADKMDKSTVGDVGEGDWIAIRAQGGATSAQVGKITGVRSLMGGRLREVSLIDSQGNETKRIVTPDTVAFVLPDLPDPQPIDEELKAGPVRASEISRGDVVTVRDVIRGGMTEVRVDRIAPSDRGFSITGTRTVDGTNFGGQVAADAVVHRSQVNPARPIDHKDVQVGDVIDWEDETGRVKLKGFVTDIIDSPTGGIDSNGKTIPSREISVRDERGNVSTVITTDGDGSDLRLVTRDPEAAAAEQRRVDEALRRETIESIAGHLSGQSASAVRQQFRSFMFKIDLSDGPDGPSSDLEHLRSMVSLNRYDKQELEGTRRRTAQLLARKLTQDRGQQEALAKNLESVIKEAEDRAVTDALRAVADAKPQDPLRDTYGKARADMARLMGDPYQSGTRPVTDADRAAARSLVLGSEALGKAPTPEVDTVPFDPALLASDTKGALARAKAIIGGGENFGKERRKVASFAPTTLADLEAGKVPEITTVDAFFGGKAEDGGPSLIAMQHTQAVKDVGASIRRDVAARVAERTANLPTLESLVEEQRKAREDRDAFTAEFRTREAALRDRLSEEKIGMGYEAAYDEIRRQRNIRWFERSGSPEREAAEKRIQELEAARLAVATELSSDPTWKADNAKYLELGKKVTDLRTQIASVGPQQRKALSDVRREVLRELRDVGGHGLAYTKGERAKATKAMRWAESYYPTDWLKAADQRDTGVGHPTIELKSVQRGYYQHGTGTIALSGGETEYTSQWINGTAIHELGHRMERQVPGLLAAEEAFLWSRTSTGEVGDRTRTAKTAIYAGKKTEVGYKDEFKEHYTGKDYGGQAYEVFTTGIESMFAGSPYADGDDDFQDFMMGVLATL